MKIILAVLFFPVFIVGALCLMLGYFLMTPFMVCAEMVAVIKIGPDKKSITQGG